MFSTFPLKQETIAVAFANTFFTPSQVRWSVLTLALKSPRRIRLSVRGVAEIILSKSSYNLSDTCSYRYLTMVACLLPDKGSLNVIRRS